MLKRQRQPSPPPPSTPFLSADPFMPVPVVVEPEDSERRHAKRRRTQPPVLDGALRGWARPETEDDGEEDVAEEEVGWSDLDENTTTTISEEYKSNNSILRDLHALHQHRVSFSSPIPSARPVLSDSSTNSTSAILSQLPPPSKRHPVIAHPHVHAGLPQSSMHKTLGQEQAQSIDEAGHYENINRYFYMFHHNFIC